MFFSLTARLVPWTVWLCNVPRFAASGLGQYNNQEVAMALLIGQQVWIPCKVQPGPFSEEPLVTFESTTGPVTGFISSDELKEIGGQTSVRGIVRSIERDYITVWIRGSFFTTNGLANVPAGLAKAA